MIIARRFLRDQRRSFLWWAAALVAAVAMTTGLYPSVRDQPGFEQTVQDLPEVFLALTGISEDLSIISAVGYLHARLFSLFMPFILVFFGLTLGTRAIAGSEADGHLELLLANPVSRRRVFVERGLAVAGLTVAMAAIGFVSTVALSTPVGLLDDIGIGRIAEAVMAGLCLALIQASISLAVGGATGRRSVAQGVASTVAIGGFVLHGIIEVTDGISFLRFLTPWHWYADRVILLEGASLQATLVPVALAVVFSAIGAQRFGVRDLR